jgi:hypothetical protein
VTPGEWGQQADHPWSGSSSAGALCLPGRTPSWSVRGAIRGHRRLGMAIGRMQGGADRRARSQGHRAAGTVVSVAITAGGISRRRRGPYVQAAGTLRLPDGPPSWRVCGTVSRRRRLVAAIGTAFGEVMPVGRAASAATGGSAGGGAFEALGGVEGAAVADVITTDDVSRRHQNRPRAPLAPCTSQSQVGTEIHANSPL